MSKTPAGERLRRVLAMVPWVVANPGVAVDQIAERFGISETDVLDDLHVVWMVGLPPYTPDALVEVVVEDSRVWIHYADFFARPLRMTPGQGLALLASSDALLSLPGTDPAGPLSRALDKLAAALNIDVDESLQVSLGAAGTEHLEPLRAAIAAGTEVQIEYFSYGRDQVSSRRVAPWHLSSNGGAWYVEAWCHNANGERLFRLDRIAELATTGQVSEHPPRGPRGKEPGFQPMAGHDRIKLRLTKGASWVVDTYPCEQVERHDDESVTATLAVSSTPWLERLLLRLGPDAEVVPDGSFDGADNVAAAAARRILGRYRS